MYTLYRMAVTTMLHMYLFRRVQLYFSEETDFLRMDEAFDLAGLPNDEFSHLLTFLSLQAGVFIVLLKNKKEVF